MAKKRQKGISGIRIITVIMFAALFTVSFFYPRFTAKTFGSENTEVKEIATTAESLQTRRGRTTTAAQTRRGRYSQFSHSTRAHQTACSNCHKFPSANWKQVRKTDAFPDITDYPQHQSCINCHRQQFFRGNPPQICSICHSNPSPRNPARHPFANPRETFDLTAKGRNAVSDFGINFPHDKHIEIVSQNENDAKTTFVKASFVSARQDDTEKSCAVCHQTYQPQGTSDIEFVTNPPANLGDRFWLKKGTFKTSPIGHSKCFSCHSTETGIKPAPTDCATCHKLKPAEPKSDFDAKVAAPMKITDKITLTSWRSRISSATFRHEFSSHADLSCATCHNVAAMNTLSAATKKVAVTSCNMCHITATADDGGVLNTEIEARKKDAKFQCVKCHIAFGRMPIPQSHIQAVEAAGK